ncbi:hypothetical protein [Caballeronia grimmiae]|nr:hypothetical protein [Caballeronia grimmiae]
MRKLVPVIETAFVYAVAILLLGCGGGGDDTPANASGFGVSRTIENSSGGVLTVVDIRSPIYGARVDIPPKALSDDAETITLSYKEVPSDRDLTAQNDSGLAFSSKILILSRSAKRSDAVFLRPVLVTIPYDQTKGDVALPVFIDEESGHYEPLEVLSDSDGLISFPIAHFSAAAVVSGSSSSIKATPHRAVGFNPATHGFFIRNFTTRFQNQSSPIDYTFMDGVCFGMSAVAKWFFDNAITSPPLFVRYQERVATAGGDDIIGRDLAASMHFNLAAHGDGQASLPADTLLSTYPNTYYAQRIPFAPTPAEKRAALHKFLAAMSFGRPQMLNFVVDRPTAEGKQWEGHTVLVFSTKCGPSVCSLFAYDPNSPGQTLEVAIAQSDLHVTYSGVRPAQDYGQIFQLGSDASFFRKASFRRSFDAAELGQNSAYDIMRITPLPSRKLVEGTKNEHYVVFADIIHRPILHVRTDIRVAPADKKVADTFNVYIDGVFRFPETLVKPITEIDLNKSSIDLSGEHQVSLVLAQGIAGQNENPKFEAFSGFYAARIRSYAGTYTGTFQGGDAGAVTVVINEEGGMTGSGSGTEDDFFIKDGQVQPDGSVDFGLTSSGARFSGQIDIEPKQWSLSGSWLNVGDEQSGKFSLTKIY